MRKRLLNVGGGSKAIKLPAEYADYEHVLFDAVDGPGVDIVGDARSLEYEMDKLRFAMGGFLDRFDVVYSAHNLEHFCEYDARLVVRGMAYQLGVGGIIDITVPNIEHFMRIMTTNNCRLDDVAYTSAAGPIRFCDVLYGLQGAIAQGHEGMAHRFGYDARMLVCLLEEFGFQNVTPYLSHDRMEVRVVGKKT